MPQTTPQLPPTESAAIPQKGKKRRLFGLILATIAILGATFYARGRFDDGALRNIVLAAGMGTIATLFSAWFVLASGLSRRVKVTASLLTLAGLVFVATIFRVEKFDGSLVPKIALRSAPPRDATLDPMRNVEATDVVPDLSKTSSDDFPSFLGKDGKNQVDGVFLHQDWSTHPPKQLWLRDVGAGWSGFSVVNGFACTLEQRGDAELVTCYEVATGRPCWSHSIEARHSSGLGFVGPRSTPTIHDGKVYVLGATGVVRCLDGSTGKAIWIRDLFKDFDMTQSEAEAEVAWGRSASPLLNENMVVVPIGGTAGGKRAGLIALNLESGETVWETEAFQASYASPRAALLHSVPQILSVNEDIVSSHDPKTGKTLWTYDWPGSSSTNANVSQPVPVDGTRVLLTKGYGKGAELIEVIADEGEWSVVGLWENRRALRTKFSNVAIHRGEAYGFDEQVLQCVDLESGDVHWTSERRFGYGQVLRVEDLLLVMNENGTMTLVAADKNAYRELGNFPMLEGQTWNTFCLVQDHLLVRNSEQAACFQLALAEPKPVQPSENGPEASP
jgi:outer membrane protein assembly factor BamB